jgi:hypothetical protein
MHVTQRAIGDHHHWFRRFGNIDVSMRWCCHLFKVVSYRANNTQSYAPIFLQRRRLFHE